MIVTFVQFVHLLFVLNDFSKSSSEVTSQLSLKYVPGVACSASRPAFHSDAATRARTSVTIMGWLPPTPAAAVACSSLILSPVALK